MQPIVYLVEDDQMLAHSIKALLISEEIGFEHFESAEHLLEALPRLRPGCILMDVYMTGVDGISTLQALKTSGLRWPAILMSGTAEGNDEHLAWASGATDFLHKPFRAAEMLESLRNAFAQLSAGSASAAATTSDRTPGMSDRPAA